MTYPKAKKLFSQCRRDHAITKLTNLVAIQIDTPEFEFDD